MITNRSVGLDFKRRVLIYLLQQGLRVKDPKEGARKLSDLVTGAAAVTDITGLEPWIVDVRVSASEDISSALKDAHVAAAAAGSNWPVVIMSRRGHDIDNAYAIMPLHVMAKIFAGDAPQPSHPVAGITV